jgi:hypothetical protein
LDAVATRAAFVSIAVLAGCAGERGGRVEFDRPPDGVFPAATAEVRRLDAALRRFAADHAGRLPTSLAQLADEPTAEGDRYLLRVPRDPWGRDYAYEVLDRRLGAYDLRSYGPDSFPGTPDDVVSGAPPVRTGSLPETP